MARDFNGSNQYLNNTNALVATQPITMACWFNSRSITAQQFLMAVVNYAGGASGSYFGLRAEGNVGGDPVRATIFDAVTSTNVDTTTGYSANTWHHACMISASTTDHRVFIDGGSKGTSSTSRSVTALSRTSIGTLDRSDTPAVHTDGLIAEAALWNVALTDAEVAILADGVSPLLVRPQSLRNYWPLVGRYSPEIDVRRGFNMALQNAPTTAVHPRVFNPTLPQTLLTPDPGKAILWQGASENLLNVLQTELNSLADSAYSASGTEVNLTTNLSQYGWLKVILKYSVAPAITYPFIEIYMIESLSGVLDYEDGNAIDPGRENLIARMPVRKTVNEQTRYIGPFHLPASRVRFVVRNRSGQALAGSGSRLQLYANNNELQ